MIGSERLQVAASIDDHRRALFQTRRTSAIMAGRPTTCIHLDRSFSSRTSGARSMHPLHSHTHVPGTGDASSVSTGHWELLRSGRSLSIGDRHIHTHTQQDARPQQRDRSGPASRPALGSVRMHARRFQRGTWLQCKQMHACPGAPSSKFAVSQPLEGPRLVPPKKFRTYSIKYLRTCIEY